MTTQLHYPRLEFIAFLSYLGAAGYLTGASNLRKRSRDSTMVQLLDDDAKVEDAGEK